MDNLPWSSQLSHLLFVFLLPHERRDKRERERKREEKRDRMPPRAKIDLDALADAKQAAAVYVEACRS